jgi:peroxiredoxin Q/BCP
MKSLRASADELSRLDVALYGASVDRPEANLKFANKLQLPFPILSDRGKQVAEAYGVLKLGLFPRRWTFVIDRDGNVAFIEKQVSPKSAGVDLVALLERLEAGGAA